MRFSANEKQPLKPVGGQNSMSLAKTFEQTMARLHMDGWVPQAKGPSGIQGPCWRRDFSNPKPFPVYHYSSNSFPSFTWKVSKVGIVPPFQVYVAMDSERTLRFRFVLWMEHIKDDRVYFETEWYDIYLLHHILNLGIYGHSGTLYFPDRCQRNLIRRAFIESLQLQANFIQYRELTQKGIDIWFDIPSSPSNILETILPKINEFLNQDFS